MFSLNYKLISLLALLISLSYSSVCFSQEYPFRDQNLPLKERVNDLIERMTIEEKVSQLMNNTPGIERLGIPPYNWWNEALHGVARAGRATVFPQAIGLAATFDSQAIYETFTIISDEARAKYNEAQSRLNYDQYFGLTFWTPNINIFRDPRWGRGMETYGEDPYLTGELATAAVKGLQGDDPHYFKTHACAKHFAVHSGPEWSRHEFDAYASSRDLWETYLPAFEKLVKDANVQEVMCAYNRLDGEPCCGNKALLNDILRNEWGYKGMIVSDCGAISDFWVKDPNTKRHETHSDKMSASIDALRSGTDLECGGDYSSLVNAFRQGKILEQEIDASLKRVLLGRFNLGMFDDQKEIPWSNIPYSIVVSPTHRQKALEMARKSIVLLKNANRILPLSKELQTIAVVGPNANDSIMQWGNYNGIPNATVTLLQGIKNKLPNAKIIYDDACDYYKVPANGNFNDVIEKIKDADVIVFAGGISPSLEGEEMPVDIPGFRKGDRTSIELPKVQQLFLKELKTLNKPIVFVLNAGSAIGLKNVVNDADALINAWYGGEEGGNAVADVLFGDYNPGGKLPITYYTSDEQLPDYTDYSMKGRTYRYLKEKPLFPFGYGLSYSDFELADIHLSESNIHKGDSIVVSMNLKNMGIFDGDEVIQVYVKNDSDIEGPIKSLRAFKRVHVQAKSSKDINMTLSNDAFLSFSEFTHRMEVIPGNYTIYIGNSSSERDLNMFSIRIE
ncbi:MAG: glycoside hydrolase family 3 C-terminal domain-containing protein [Dysgonamonadaceae bacterium]